MSHIGFNLICITNISSINYRSPPSITIVVVDDYSVCILNVNYYNLILHIVFFKCFYWEQHYSNIN